MCPCLSPDPTRRDVLEAEAALKVLLTLSDINTAILASWLTVLLHRQSV